MEAALNEPFDLIILDVMLSTMDGFEICRAIRKKKQTPIMIVSAKKEDIDKIRGVGLSADDYIMKPSTP
ncbi:response regulator, partial [Enterococcus faecalis]|uniref:response regulator n=1 Tax=Enterococcus faecalis TaxID=1351 RepID=UPI003D6AAEA9